MENIEQVNPKSLLIGQWTASDGFGSVVISISPGINGFKVSVIDESDDEVAEIYDIKNNDEQLSFNAHWPSNGSFIKYRFLLTAKNVVDVTYTYSAQETWLRKET